MWVTIALLGIVYVFFLNIARLVLNLLLGLKIQEWLGDSTNAKLYSSLVDRNLVWGIYAIGFFLFFTLFFHLIGANKEQISEGEG